MNLKDNNGWTPIFVAAASGTYGPIYDARFNDNIQFKKFNTFSNYQGHERIVQLLIKNGSDVNVKNNEGLTPLHAAAEFGRFSI